MTHYFVYSHQEILLPPVQKNPPNSPPLPPTPTWRIGTLHSSQQMLTDRLHLLCSINILHSWWEGVGGWGGGRVSSCVCCSAQLPSKGDAVWCVFGMWTVCVCVRECLGERSLPCQPGAQLQKPSSVIGQQGTTACRTIRWCRQMTRIERN